MLQVARLAPGALGDAGDLVPTYLRGSVNADGGFQDRAGNSDLYYTVFGLESLLAFREEPPPGARRYLEGFGDGASLDFVHLCSLARCWASVSADGPSPDVTAAILQHLETYRSGDGAYAVSRGEPHGTIYASFLALGAAQDLRADVPNRERLLECVIARRAVDGGYANHPGAVEGSTPATAAAVMLLRHLDANADPSASDWLLARCHRDGGFFAAPGAPIPDLLSTATALHALAALHTSFDHLREPCLDFLDSLWTSRGGFFGSWPDDTLDCEYTYYGLLALGHLSL